MAGDRDRLGVAGVVHAAAMMIQLTCPWCEDEVAFEVDEAADEIVCTACGIHLEFAPDPVATFSLLYAAA
jgi:transcription elongation factor Elf1